MRKKRENPRASRVFCNSPDSGIGVEHKWEFIAGGDRLDWTHKCIRCGIVIENQENPETDLRAKIRFDDTDIEVEVVICEVDLESGYERIEYLVRSVNEESRLLIREHEKPGELNQRMVQFPSRFGGWSLAVLRPTPHDVGRDDGDCDDEELEEAKRLVAVGAEFVISAPRDRPKLGITESFCGAPEVVFATHCWEKTVGQLSGNERYVCRQCHLPSGTLHDPTLDLRAKFQVGSKTVEVWILYMELLEEDFHFFHCRVEDEVGQRLLASPPQSILAELPGNDSQICINLGLLNREETPSVDGANCCFTVDCCPEESYVPPVKTRPDGVAFVRYGMPLPPLRPTLAKKLE